MPSKTIIIQGHPDSSRRHLCHALADTYADAASQAGHEVSRIEIAGIEFPMLRTQEEFNSGTPPASLKSAAEAIVAADHIVLVFPLWLGTVPAMAKALLEQVIRPGVAFPCEKYGAKNCWPAVPRISSSPWGCRPGCIGRSIAAMAFAGCAETYSSLSASRRFEPRCSAWSRTRLRRRNLVGWALCARMARKCARNTTPNALLKSLRGPGDHILRNSAERLAKRGDGSRRLDPFEFLAILEQARCDNLSVLVDNSR